MFFLILQKIFNHIYNFLFLPIINHILNEWLIFIIILHQLVIYIRVFFCQTFIEALCHLLWNFYKLLDFYTCRVKWQMCCLKLIRRTFTLYTYLFISLFHGFSKYQMTFISYNFDTKFSFEPTTNLATDCCCRIIPLSQIRSLC